LKLSAASPNLEYASLHKEIEKKLPRRRNAHFFFFSKLPVGMVNILLILVPDKNIYQIFEFFYKY